MQPQDLEPEMEALLHHICPDLDEAIEGATEADIDRIRGLVGHELPRFYDWFLRRMGRSMGPLASPCVDYSASRVLWCYDQGLAEPDPDELLIGYDICENPLDFHLFYDFTHPCRHDAMVSKGEPDAGPVYPAFETFREHLGWGKVMTHLIGTSPSHCKGIIRSLSNRNAVDQLKVSMVAHGFSQPLDTGPFCGIFMRADLTMICSRGISNPTDMAAFEVGGQSHAWLRRFLGDIATSDELELRERTLEWDYQ